MFSNISAQYGDPPLQPRGPHLQTLPPLPHPARQPRHQHRPHGGSLDGRIQAVFLHGIQENIKCFPFPIYVLTQHRADLKGADIGDLTARHAIKDRLECKDFRWFLETVYPHKFIMDEQSVAWGRMRASTGQNKVCIDHLQRDMVSHHLIVALRSTFSRSRKIN